MSAEQGPLIIGLVGPTGAGKTSLTRRLGEVLDGQIYEEKPQENPYFGAHTADLNNGVKESENILRSELFFLRTSFAQAKAFARKGEIMVWDVPLPGHMMYAQLLRDQGSLSEAQFQEYRVVYQECLNQIPVPDILCLVTVKQSEELVKHILERHRPEEMATPVAYWASQIVYWQNHLTELNQWTNTVVLHSDEIDWRVESGSAGLIAVLNVLAECEIKPHLFLNSAARLIQSSIH